LTALPYRRSADGRN